MLYYNLLPNSRNAYMYITIMKHIKKKSYLIYLIVKIQILIFYCFVGSLLIFASLQRKMKCLGLDLIS